MLQTIRSLGTLRLALLLMALIDAIAVPAPGTPVILEGMKIFTTLIAPAAAPLIAMVILFDIMMSRIRAKDSDGAEKEKFRKIAWVEIIAVGLLILVWLPYFRMIGQ